MTPMPVQPGTGLSGGASHDIFPEGAKEQVRNWTPWEPATVYEQQTTKSGGATRETFLPSEDSPVDARIDATGTSSDSMRGATMHEDTTHIITFRKPREGLDTVDRVNIHGSDWSITAVQRNTDNWVDQVEVVAT